MTKIQYSKCQMRTLNTVQDWLDGTIKTKHLIIKAGAGRGKTFLLANVFNKQTTPCVSIPPMYSMHYTATTHQAIDMIKANRVKSQVKTQLRMFEPVEDYSTLHSFLGVSPSDDQTKKYIWNPAPFKHSPYLFINNYSSQGFGTVIVVDEAFRMDKVIYDILLYRYPQGRFIFIGDPYQTPPIGEKTSCINNLSDTYIVELVTPMRFKESLLADRVENLLLCTKFEESNWYNLSMPTKDLVSNTGWASYAQVKKWVNTYINMPMLSERFTIVCGTREKADYFNTYIAKERFKANKEVIIHPNECSIEYTFNHKPKNILAPKFDAKDFYNKLAKTYIPKADLGGISVLTPKNGGTPQLFLFGNKGKALSGKALAACHMVASQYSDTVHIFKPTMAKTIHLAQGLSCKHVVVDMPSINVWKDEDMRRRLTYTAASRASEELYFVE